MAAKRIKDAKVVASEERAVAVRQEVDPERLIAKALDKGLPVEALEKLLAMRRELKAEWAKERYFSALAGFQSECPTIEKKKAVANKDGSLRYHYAPLEDIIGQLRTLLEKYGFSYTAFPKQTAGHVGVVTTVYHRDGHGESCEVTIPIEPSQWMNGAQVVGSALTYARRYSFCGAFGIATADEDDEGQSAGTPGGNGGKKEEPEEPKRKSARTEQGTTGGKAPETEKKTAQPITSGERRLPKDPMFAKLKPDGVEVYWLLRDAFAEKLLEREYCEATMNRIRQNPTNLEFLADMKAKVQDEILKRKLTQKEKA